jgi:hypothetical protein
VTLINNMTRLRAGFPFLSAVEEMTHYGVEDPYSRDHTFYVDEILYAYVITPDEIVTTWKWSEVETYLDTHSVEEWVENIVRRELHEHEKQSVAAWKRQHPAIDVLKMALANAQLQLQHPL